MNIKRLYIENIKYYNKALYLETAKDVALNLYKEVNLENNYFEFLPLNRVEKSIKKTLDIPRPKDFFDKEAQKKYKLEKETVEKLFDNDKAYYYKTEDNIEIKLPKKYEENLYNELIKHCNTLKLSLNCPNYNNSMTEEGIDQDAAIALNYVIQGLCYYVNSLSFRTREPYYFDEIEVLNRLSIAESLISNIEKKALC